jgi:hypothetical protein
MKNPMSSPTGRAPEMLNRVVLSQHLVILTGRPKAGKIKGSKRSSPYDANFEQDLIQVKIYLYSYEYPDGNVPPLGDNYEGTNQRLAQYRASLLPSRFSDGDRQKFLQKDAKARNEPDIKMEVLPALLDAMSTSGGAQKDILTCLPAWRDTLCAETNEGYFDF